MTIPIAEELNVRERIERLFETSSAEVEFDVAAACLEQATEGLKTAIAAIIASDFELEGPDVLAWAPGDSQEVPADQVVFQFLRAPTGAQFRCSLANELIRGLVRAGFGGVVGDNDAGFESSNSAFGEFFASNVALSGVRALAFHVTGTRSQNIIFDQTIEHDEATVPEAPNVPGFLATWQFVFDEVRHAMVVFLPASEFYRLAEQDRDESIATTDTADGAAWSDRMQSSVAAAEVQLIAVMNRPDMPLEQLYSLQVGDVVEFADPQSTSVLLECDGVPLFDCEVGQKHGYFAVHVRGEL